MKGYKIRYESIFNRSSPILKVGSLNLKTGLNSQGWNIYENRESTIEVWRDYSGDTLFIMTSGTSPLYKKGSEQSFIHNQSRRPVNGGEMYTMVDYSVTNPNKTPSQLWKYSKNGKISNFFVYK